MTRDGHSRTDTDTDGCMRELENKIGQLQTRQLFPNMVSLKATSSMNQHRLRPPL